MINLLIIYNIKYINFTRQHASVPNPKLEFASDADELYADYLRFSNSPQSSSRFRRIDQRNNAC